MNATTAATYLTKRAAVRRAARDQKFAESVGVPCTVTVEPEADAYVVVWHHSEQCYRPNGSHV